MKIIIILLISIISFQAYSFSSIKMPEYPNTWRLIKKEKDTTLENGIVKVKFRIKQLFNKQPIRNTTVTFNSDYLMGKTDEQGLLSILVKPSRYKMCADTPLGNGITKYFVLENQTSYVFEIKMRLKKQKRQVYGRNDIQPKKPVIYLYPKRKQNVNVQVFPKGEFSFTYPQYPKKGGWNVIAKPNGKIEYKNRTYNYLFWEGVESPAYNFTTNIGFEVDSDTLVQFLENVLSTVGLTTEEQTDFITYWAPKLEESQLNFIHFLFNEDYDKYISTNKITPSPNSTIRVFMVYHYIEELEYIKQQEIPIYKRKGFTLVEWGGSYF